MLILVGVSVSVALQGGLFTKAKNASDDTKEAVIREQLQDIILGKLDVNNNTIPKDLGQVILDGITYDVTATKPTTPADAEIIISLVDSNNSSNNFDKKLKTDLKIGGEIEIEATKPKVYGSASSLLLNEENRNVLRTVALSEGVPAQLFDNIDFNSSNILYSGDMNLLNECVCVVFSDKSIMFTFLEENKEGALEDPFIVYFSNLTYPIVWDGGNIWPAGDWAESAGEYPLFEFYDDYGIERFG